SSVTLRLTEPSEGRVPPSSMSTQTVTEEKEPRCKTTASMSTQTDTEEKEPRRKTTASMGPASSQVEERENRVFWTVWVRWPGTSDPQRYTALVDTGAQCTLMPSRYVGAEPISISGVTGGSQQLTVLEAEVSLTGNEWQKHSI
uniref:Uncharacterized protein n=1 Tax=Corvus moneduloides TaxID=1196302 RepID=A0A8U7MAH9_CORMO